MEYSIWVSGQILTYWENIRSSHFLLLTKINLCWMNELNVGKVKS